MCAIAGILGLPFDSQILDTLLHTMQHRGPDGNGSYMQCDDASVSLESRYA